MDFRETGGGLIPAVELVINQEKQNQSEQNSGEKTEAKGVIPGEKGPLFLLRAQIGVTMLAPGGVGRNNLPAKGAPDGFFYNGHGANMLLFSKIDQQKTRDGPQRASPRVFKIARLSQPSLYRILNSGKPVQIQFGEQDIALAAIPEELAFALTDHSAGDHFVGDGRQALEVFVVL